jgi:hypothetical protein
MWYTGIDQHKQFCVLTTYGAEGPRVAARGDRLAGRQEGDRADQPQPRNGARTDSWHGWPSLGGRGPLEWPGVTPMTSSSTPPDTRPRSCGLAGVRGGRSASPQPGYGAGRGRPQVRQFVEVPSIPGPVAPPPSA